MAWNLIGLAVSLDCVQAQTVTTLVPFTNTWRFDDSGLELGTAWRTNDYNDSAWASGPGLLGVEPDTPAVYTVHALINTPLTIFTTVTSYYFRTTFDFAGSTNGLSLVASNLVDDGCVVYLNGQEAGRFRVPANQNANTLAQGALTEGQLDVVTFANLSLLRQGTNLLAVEVHQSSVGSSDTMWGMKLLAIQATPLTITNQPQSQVVMVGDPVNFSAGVSGGPAFYQWRKDGLNLASQTNATYSIPSVQLFQAGIYEVIITNAVSSVISSNAVLTVHPDSTGPKLVSAFVRETGVTNEIIVQFSESLLSGFIPNSPTTNTLNYRVTMCGNANDVDILDAGHSSSRVRLRVGGSNWVIGSCYYVTVNNVTDTKTNRIAPDSQVGVSWPRHLDLLAPDAAWSFHASAVFDPGIYDEDWTSANYVEGPWWGQGTGIFYAIPTSVSSCLGNLETAIGFQPEPSLFRTTFDWSADLGPNAELRIDVTVDDGAAVYLNGTEIWRNNLPASPAPPAAATRSPTSIGVPACMLNIGITVTNLLPGTNWLAAGVAQAASGNADAVFGLRLKAIVLVPARLPESPIPALNLSPLGTNDVRLWWTGSGYALESATNLSLGFESAPFGPWMEVTKMSNPYTNNLSTPTRFFRLKK